MDARPPGTVEAARRARSNQSQGSMMERGPRPRWFGARVAFALAVVALVAVELTSRRYRLAGIVQAVLIVGVIVASVVDIREIFHRNRP